MATAQSILARLETLEDSMLRGELEALLQILAEGSDLESICVAPSCTKLLVRTLGNTESDELAATILDLLAWLCVCDGFRPQFDASFGLSVFLDCVVSRPKPLADEFARAASGFLLNLATDDTLKAKLCDRGVLDILVPWLDDPRVSSTAAWALSHLAEDVALQSRIAATGAPAKLVASESVHALRCMAHLTMRRDVAVAVGKTAFPVLAARIAANVPDSLGDADALAANIIGNLAAVDDNWTAYIESDCMGLIPKLVHVAADRADSVPMTVLVHLVRAFRNSSAVDALSSRDVYLSRVRSAGVCQALVAFRRRSSVVELRGQSRAALQNLSRDEVAKILIEQLHAEAQPGRRTMSVLTVTQQPSPREVKGPDDVVESEVVVEVPVEVPEPAPAVEQGAIAPAPSIRVDAASPSQRMSSRMSADLTQRMSHMSADLTLDVNDLNAALDALDDLDSPRAKDDDDVHDLMEPPPLATSASARTESSSDSLRIDSPAGSSAVSPRASPPATRAPTPAPPPQSAGAAFKLHLAANEFRMFAIPYNCTFESFMSRAEKKLGFPCDAAAGVHLLYVNELGVRLPLICQEDLLLALALPKPIHVYVVGGVVPSWESSVPRHEVTSAKGLHTLRRKLMKR